MEDEQQAWQNIAVHTQLRLDFAHEQVDLLREQVQTIRVLNHSLMDQSKHLRKLTTELIEALYAFTRLVQNQIDDAVSDDNPPKASPFLDGSGAGE